jgi:hypothetical protein
MPLVEDSQSSHSKQPRYTLCRVCYRGVLTLEEAQTKLGQRWTVIEVRPAECVGDQFNELIAATEVLFFQVPFGGALALLEAVAAAPLIKRGELKGVLRRLQEDDED